MKGLHLIGDWNACRGGRNEMRDAEALRALSLRLVQEAGLSVVGANFHQFAPQGVTGVLLLAESHLALHTWPELELVTADLHVCNLARDNSARARQVFEALQAVFAPDEARVAEIVRGAGAEAAPARLTEWLNADYAYTLTAGTPLEAARTAFQQLEVWDTPGFGRLFRLDGSFMSSEADEFFYHENLVHIPAIAHPAPRTALVIGGGDGGSTEELLKHPSIAQVTVVEIDAAVVAMARRQLGAIHHGVFDDPRLRLLITDGLAFVQQTEERFDLLILDLTDPGGPSAPLYTPEFYVQCAARLNPGGAMSLHIGAPFFQPERFQQAIADLKRVFACVRPYLVAVPLYGALWGMACASQTLDPRALPAAEVAQRLAARGIGGLSYYNAETHGAVLALPGFVEKLAQG